MNYIEGIDSPQDLRRLPRSALGQVASELRQLILETINRNGGHLGAAMGAVELAIAVHYVFDSPYDRIIWDVGHQAHAHKILTGRRQRFHTIKRDGGLSGFLKRSESPHDIFGAGHASTSLSAATGIREALRLKDASNKVVALIGDGGLTGGMAFEALNHAGALKRDLIVILNDNGMSISPNVGALSEWFSRKLTGESMTRWRRRIRQLLGALNDDAVRMVEQLLDRTKQMVATPGVLFEGLGFEYIGPIDGHDLETLIDTLTDARRLNRAVVVHCKTRKGEGIPGADHDLERYHGVQPYELQAPPHSEATESFQTSRTRQRITLSSEATSFTSVFGQTICQLAAADPRVVAITAAMTQGTGLVEFSRRFPERFYDVGIAEAHAVTFAAGMACEGFRPVCAIYSTFLQRAFDQVIHDVCLQELPVTFCIDRAGLVGADGPTHHGVFDICYLRTIPNLALIAPRSLDQLPSLLAAAIDRGEPVAIRWPKGAPAATLPRAAELPWGQAEVLFESGPELLLIASGTMVPEALAAANQLSERIGVTLIDPRFLKPLDADTLCPRLARASAIVTVEEGVLAGGLGSAVLELCETNDLRPRVRRLGIADTFVDHGDIARLRGRFGLNRQGIVAAYESIAAEGQIFSIR
ncbi:MAG: 1-deoxy-D-xylulose-5-phosphate synthase [Deltaproteobacteria bacterium]|nr:1-deoxy-D-xylulose-5-phosphate synthase [Deltaproteobacteria bacterium]